MYETTDMEEFCEDEGLLLIIDKPTCNLDGDSDGPYHRFAVQQMMKLASICAVSRERFWNSSVTEDKNVALNIKLFWGIADDSLFMFFDDPVGVIVFEMTDAWTDALAPLEVKSSIWSETELVQMEKLLIRRGEVKPN